MIKRPIAFGAVVLIVILYLGSYFGVSETVPPHFPDTGTQIQLLGKVKTRELTDYGARLYLDECNILSIQYQNSKNNSNQISNKSKVTQSKLQIKEKSNLKKKKQILVYLSEKQEKISVGSWIIVEGIYAPFEAASNPGQFHQAAYYEARNVVCMVKKAKILKQWRQRNYAGLLNELRSVLQDSLKKVLGSENAALTAAMVLGIREDLPEELKELYQDGGIAHILAISSLHITLIGRSIYQILRKIRCSLLSSALVSGSILFSFCLMTGMSVSAKRACIMYLLWLGSQIFGRYHDQPTALGFAAWMVLLFSPGYLRDSGFILSFSCILALQYVLPMIKIICPLPGKIGSALQASIAIQVGTLPVVMRFFYQVTPYGFLVNLIVLPLMGILMVSGLISAILGMIWLPAGIMTAAPCHYLLELFSWICRMERRIPGAIVITGAPKNWQIVVYYGLLGGICFGAVICPKRWKSLPCKKVQRKKTDRVSGFRQRLRLIGSGWLFCALAVMIVGYRPLPGLRIAVLDVGQGDGILIQSKSFACLVDGGSSSVNNVWKYRIESALKYYGIDQLDAVLISHGDQDHISGVEELLNDYEIGWKRRNVGGITVKHLLVPELGYPEEKLQKLTDKARQLKIAVGQIPKGGRLAAGELELTCLAPNAKNTTGDSNQDSMVLLLTFGEFEALLTGDMEKEGESLFLQSWKEEHDLEDRKQKGIDLLKVSHHGSKNGTSQEFLQEFQPSVAVISCGKENRYGHPSKEVLQRLEACGTRIVRTDQEGAFIIEIP